jgi:hypothetical protein
MAANQAPLPTTAARAVRQIRLDGRSFYATPCKFFIDVPLDMSGCILGAVREAAKAGLRVVPGGLMLVCDTHYRGAVLVEVMADAMGQSNVVVVGGSLLARDLPPKGAKLRAELDELVRWSLEIGLEVTGCYVRYEPVGSLPGALRPAEIFASVNGELEE